MSGENKKKQGNFGFPVAYIGAMVLTLSAYSLGHFVCADFPGSKMLAFVFLGLLIACIIASPIASKRYWKRVHAQNVREMNNQADERQERMDQDPQGEWRKLLRLSNLAKAYVVFLWATCILIPLFYGASGLDTNWIIVELIPMFFLSGLIGKLIREKGAEDPGVLLPEDKFPKLYALVRQTGGDRLNGYKLSIRVIHGIPDEECNCSVAMNPKEIRLWIGAVLLCVLDEGELKQVLLHEFGHMDKEEMSQHRIYNRIMGYMAEDPKSVISLSELALSFPVDVLHQEGSFYFLLSSREKERQADSRAASGGNPEKQCSALAKIAAHNLYFYEQCLYDNLFVNEHIPQHLMTDRARAFRDALVKREEVWRELLEHELPSRFDSHPIFRQRWEDLGCCSYSLMPAETESDFAKECWAAAETADEDRASTPKENYDRMRKEGYLDPSAIIAEFESTDAELSPDELREPAYAYFKIGKPEKMEEICDKILAEYDSPFATAFANYWKGYLKLHRYDRSGLDYIYRAMDANSNYIQSGLDDIGQFCTMMGLETELEKYRSRAPELIQLKVDRNVGGIHAKAKLEPAQLPESWQEKILDFIRSVAEDDLKAVYLVRELASEDYTPSSFVLRFKENTPQERVDQIYDRVFYLLDDWPEDYEFALYIYDDNMEKPLSRVEGSCIYQVQE